MTSSLYYLGDGDNGGVHINTGINNKAVYPHGRRRTFNGQTVVGLGVDEGRQNLLRSSDQPADVRKPTTPTCSTRCFRDAQPRGDCQASPRATVSRFGMRRSRSK